MSIPKRYLFYAMSFMIFLLLLTGICLTTTGTPTLVVGPDLTIPTPASPQIINVGAIEPPIFSTQSSTSPIAQVTEGCKNCTSVSAEESTIIRDSAIVNMEVAAVNQEIEANDWDWVAGPTSVSYKSKAYRENLRGLKHHTSPDSTFYPSPELSVNEVEASALPKSFDWRSKGGRNWLTPVRDQGNCGSCWAFAVTGAFESYWERLKRNSGLNPNFAEQLLVSCARDQDGCDGGYFTAMKYFVNSKVGGAVGTVQESKYPYRAADTSCKSLSGVTRYKVKSGGRWGYVGGGSEWTIPSVSAIKSAVYNYGPVVAGVYADDDFDYYESGIFGTTLSSRLSDTNHAVLIVGWGTTSSGKTYWIVKNSWGTGWGINGYFKIYAGYNRIGEGAAYFSKNF